MLSTQRIEVKKLSFSFKKLILLLRWLYNYIYTVFYIRIYMLESISCKFIIIYWINYSISMVVNPIFLYNVCVRMNLWEKRLLL